MDRSLSGKAPKLFYPALALLMMTAALILTKTGRDSLYLQKNGLFDLPWAYLGIAFLAVPVSALVLTEVRSVGPRRTRVISPLVMAIVQVAFYFVAEPGGGVLMTLFFMLVPVAYGVLLSMTWLLGAELLEGEPQERLVGEYATLGAASMFGGVCGGLSAKLLAPHIDPQVLILIGAVALCLSIGATIIVHQRFPARVRDPSWQEALPPAKSRTMPLLTEITGVLKHHYVRLLLAVAMMASVVGLFIEFQFYAVAAAGGSAEQEIADFFANFYIVLTGMALLLQILAMPALQRWIGVNGSLLILPLALLSGATVLVLSASSLARYSLRIAEGGLKSSIHRSNWEQSYLPLSGAERIVAKVMVDGMGIRMAEGLAATMLLVWLNWVVVDRDLTALDASWIAYFILGGVLLWIAFTYAMGRRLTPEQCAELKGKRLRSSIPLADS